MLRGLSIGQTQEVRVELIAPGYVKIEGHEYLVCGREDFFYPEEIKEAFDDTYYEDYDDVYTFALISVVSQDKTGYVAILERIL